MMRGLFGSMADRVGDFARSRFDEVNLNALLSRHFGMQSKSGVSIDVDKALGVTTVLACTRALAEGIAQVPIKVLREDEREHKHVEKKHSVHRVLARRPNEWMTSFGFRETMMYHAVLTGDGVAIKVMAGKRFLELIPVMPSNRRICRNADHSLRYDIYDDSGNKFLELDQSQVFHLRGPSWNAYRGLEVISLARDAIGLAISTEENHALLHRNGSRVGGILTTEKALTQPDLQRVRELWEQKTVGPGSAYGTRILDKGMKYERLGMSGVDTEHLATREHQIQEICRAMGVFPMIIGYSDKTATYASAESFFTAHVVSSLGPWFRRWQDTCETQLLTDQEFDEGYIVRLFPNGLLRGDHRARAAFYQVMVLTGIFTRNECRVLEDMNPLDGLDDPLVPLNMGAVGQEQPDPSAPADQRPPAGAALPNMPIAPKSVVDAMAKFWLGHNGGPI